eukprot:c32248_g1_i1.p2 GENE.c32248_g1_i1~~c32248_g1_i1.p2  ORF type:complete len:145 (-),score=25.34 c32248_g1_i1:103-537(-)
MQALFAVLLVALACGHVAAGLSWTNCGVAADHLHINSIIISPDVPVAGESITVSLDGVLDESINGGSVTLQFLWGRIVVATKALPMCGASSALGASCPVPAGPLVQKMSFNLPNDIPSGAYTGKISAVDEKGQEILCLSAALHF